MNTLLEFDDIHLDYPRRSTTAGRGERITVLDGISLGVQKSEILGLVGESGCGKSSLAGVLMGTILPSSGTVKLDGQSLSAARTVSQRRRIQMVFQDPMASLNPRKSVRSVLAELITHHGLVPETGLEPAMLTLLETVGLPARALDARPRDLSGGQRQRVAIARALAVQPEILVADEAVSALDVSVQARVINLLADLREEFGLTMIFISHDLGVVRALCDRVAIMKDGLIVEDSPSEELFINPQHSYTQRLLSAIPMPFGA